MGLKPRDFDSHAFTEQIQHMIQPAEETLARITVDVATLSGIVGREAAAALLRQLAEEVARGT